MGTRPASFDYYSQVARAADSLGYEGVLLPTGRGCEDAWVTAAGLAAVTQKLKFLVAVRPGLVSPTVAYRMAATFDRQTRGRILINVVTGADVDELHGDGLFLSHDERYEQTDEFLSIWRGLERGETVDHHGKHLRVAGARDLFRSGDSGEAERRIRDDPEHHRSVATLAPRLCRKCSASSRKTCP